MPGNLRIIALEMSHGAGTLAAATGDSIDHCLALPPDRRSAETMAPAMANLLDQLGWQPADVDVVGVGTGPGSFTGLRVAITLARLFAYSVGAELFGVDTFESVAMLAPAQANRLWVVVDALRGQVHAARMDRTASGAWLRQPQSGPCDAQQWIASLSAEDFVSGPGLEKWSPQMPTTVTLVEASLRYPQASAVALLAGRSRAAGRPGNLWGLMPDYGRLSAAEEKRAKPHGGTQPVESQKS